MLKTKRIIARDDPRLPDLRRFADRLQHAIAATPRDQPVGGLDRIPGADAGDSVTCYVDSRGEFVDLSLRSDWWYTVGPSGIASAVLDALTFAQEKATAATMILEHYGRQVALPNPYTFLEAADAPAPADPEAELAAAWARTRCRRPTPICWPRTRGTRWHGPRARRTRGTGSPGRSRGNA